MGRFYELAMIISDKLGDNLLLELMAARSKQVAHADDLFNFFR
jgi:hypothetical protein